MSALGPLLVGREPLLSKSGRSTPARLIQRVQIVLAAADGQKNKEIAVTLGCTRRAVGAWRNRLEAERLSGIKHDAPRGGRTATQRVRFEAEIICLTTQESPPHATQWSKRSLAKALGAATRCCNECGGTMV
jgi:hypothetical protein